MKQRAIVIAVILTAALSGCSEQQKLSTHSAVALHAYEEGVSLWQQFYYTEAKQAYERSLEADSTFALAWGRLAMLNAGTLNESKAHADISRAIRYSQKATQKEQLFIRMWNDRIYFRYKEAAAVADSLIKFFPDEPEAYLARGNLYETSKDYEAAIRAYRKSATLDTSFTIAVMSLGYAYSTQGEHEKALASMERYIRLAPDAADPRASYADLLLRLGRYEDALEQYNRALQLKPDYWYAILKVGEIYDAKGRLKDAEKEYHRGYDALPQGEQSKATYLVTDAGVNMHRGKYAEAARQFGDALAIDSVSGNAAFGLMQARIKLKDFKNIDQLVDRIKRVLETRNLTESPVMQTFYLMKARLFTAQGSLRSALEACEAALEYSSPLSRGSVYRQIAEIRLKGESYEAAIDACEEALRANPNSPEILLTLLRVYHAKGDRRMTNEIGSRLLDFWKNADPDFQNLIEVKKFLGIPA